MSVEAAQSGGGGGEEGGGERGGGEEGGAQESSSGGAGGGGVEDQPYLRTLKSDAVRKEIRDEMTYHDENVVLDTEHQHDLEQLEKMLDYNESVQKAAKRIHTMWNNTAAYHRVKRQDQYFHDQQSVGVGDQANLETVPSAPRRT